jgi:hypothetical protein
VVSWEPAQWRYEHSRYGEVIWWYAAERDVDRIAKVYIDLLDVLSAYCKEYNVNVRRTLKISL